MNEACKALGGKTPSELIMKKPNLPNNLSGTYVHQRLVIPIANWVSPRFEFMASAIITNYLAKEVIDTKDQLIKG